MTPDCVSDKPITAVLLPDPIFCDIGNKSTGYRALRPVVTGWDLGSSPILLPLLYKWGKYTTRTILARTRRLLIPILDVSIVNAKKNMKRREWLVKIRLQVQPLCRQIWLHLFTQAHGQTSSRVQLGSSQGRWNLGRPVRRGREKRKLQLNPGLRLRLSERRGNVSVHAGVKRKTSSLLAHTKRTSAPNSARANSTKCIVALPFRFRVFTKK